MFNNLVRKIFMMNSLTTFKTNSLMNKKMNMKNHMMIKEMNNKITNKNKIQISNKIFFLIIKRV